MSINAASPSPSPAMRSRPSGMLRVGFMWIEIILQIGILIEPVADQITY